MNISINILGWCYCYIIMVGRSSLVVERRSSDQEAAGSNPTTTVAGANSLPMFSDETL